MLLFCVKTTMKESCNFELTRLKKKKKKKKKERKRERKKEIKKRKKECRTFWSSSDFLVQYFHDAFLCHWACCWS